MLLRVEIYGRADDGRHLAGTLMEAFNVERMHNAALSVGLAQGALDMAVGYARKREQFGRPIAEFQAPVTGTFRAAPA